MVELEPIKEASKIVANLVKELQAIDIDIKFFDVGGGLGVVYDNETTISPYDYAQAILESLKGQDLTIICEPGRFLTANGGYFITRVLYEKNNDGKRFIVVDGAMNDLIRPSLYKAYHQVEVLNNNQNFSKADIVGPICESGDFFVKDANLPKTKHNDLIIIKSAGAYGFTMSSNYNSRPKTAEVAIIDKKDQLIRKREKFKDLIKLEEEYL